MESTSSLLQSVEAEETIPAEKPAPAEEQLRLCNYTIF